MSGLRQPNVKVSPQFCGSVRVRIRTQWRAFLERLVRRSELLEFIVRFVGERFEPREFVLPM